MLNPRNLNPQNFSLPTLVRKRGRFGSNLSPECLLPKTSVSGSLIADNRGVETEPFVDTSTC